eukprot:3232877-Prymnesium_polylepis.1
MPPRKRQPLKKQPKGNPDRRAVAGKARGSGQATARAAARARPPPPADDSRSLGAYLAQPRAHDTPGPQLPAAPAESSRARRRPRSAARGGGPASDAPR